MRTSPRTSGANEHEVELLSNLINKSSSIFFISHLDLTISIFDLLIIIREVVLHCSIMNLADLINA
jgi:hypothetical protein